MATTSTRAITSSAVAMGLLVGAVGGFLLARGCAREAPGGFAGRSSPRGAGTAPGPVPAIARAHTATETQMRNVDFHVDRSAVLRVRFLRGSMKAREAGQPVDFDDKHSFVIHIDRATIGVNASTIDVLMNSFAFGYRDAPLRNLHSAFEGGQLVQSGVMHKGVDVRFQMRADVSATADGRLRIHPAKVKTLGLNALSLLHFFGMKMGSMLDLRNAVGVTADRDDLLIDLSKLIPAPEVEGHLSSARVEGDELVETFDSGAHLPDLAVPASVRNYMDYRHGTLRMGKLLMVDADMLVIDTDPRDPFDFFLDRYNDQLVAGFSRNQPDFGLEVHMRDFDDLGTPPKPGERLAP